MTGSLLQNQLFRGWLALCGVLSLLFLAIQWTRGGADVMVSDGVGYFAHLPSLLLDGDADYSREFARFDKQGRNHWPIGTALLWSPFYLVGHLISLSGNYAGLGWTAEGTGLPEQLACCLASIAMGSAAVVISFGICRRWFSARVCLLGLLGLFAACNLPYYLLVEPYMSHAASAFLASILVALCCQESPLDKRRAAQFGLLAGLMALTRPQDGLFLALPFVLALLRGQSPRELATPLLVSGALAALVFSPQVLLWQQSVDSAAPTGKGHWVPGGRHQWLSPRLSWALFGPRDGLFLWHPVTLAAVAGLVTSARRNNPVMITALLGFFLQLYVVAAWGGQGQTFGGRMFLVCFPLFALGLCALISRLRQAFPVVAASLLLLGALNLWMVVSYKVYFAINPKPTVLQALLHQQNQQR